MRKLWSLAGFGMRKSAIFLAIWVVPGVSIAQAAEPGKPVTNSLSSLFDLRGTIAVSSGYDSNPDEAAEADGSAFVRLDAEGELAFGEEDGLRGSIGFDGSLIRFSDDTFGTDHEYLAEASVEYALTDSVDVALGGFRYEDGTDDPATLEEEIWASVKRAGALFDLDFRGSVNEYKENIDRAEVEDDDLEVFDYRTYSGTLKSRLLTASPVRPVAELRLSRLDYLERRPGKPERDATEYSIMAGLQFEATQTLRVQLGLRGNERFFDVGGTDSHTNIGPDIQIEWAPGDSLSVDFSLVRGFEEAAYEEGLIRDVTSAEIDAAYQATERLSLGAGGKVSAVEEVGAAYRKTELEAHGDVRWKLRDNVNLLLEGYVLREIRHDDADESFTRGVVRAGLEASL